MKTRGVLMVQGRMTGLPAWKELFRSRTAAVLTVASGAVLVFLLVQLLAGGPASQTVTLHLQSAEGEGEGFYRGRIPEKVAVLDWNAPLVRVFVKGVEFVQYKGVDRVGSAPAPTSYVKGRTVYLRNPAGAEPLVRCLIKVPWVPGIVPVAAVLALFLALNGLLAWAGNAGPFFWEMRVGGLPLTARMLHLLLVAAFLVRLLGFWFPSWENDSDDYFRPVFQWLSGLPIGPTDRPLGYPAFIALVLGVFSDYRPLVVLNMAASLCAAAAMGWVFFAAARRLFRPGWWRFLAQMAGLLATAYFALNERMLAREWMLLPEALAAAWLGGQLWLAWRLMTKPLSHKRALWEFGAFCALGWLTFFTKSNWGFALALLPFPVIVRALTRTRSWRETVRQLGAATAVCLLVAALAFGVQRLTPRNTAASVEIRSRVLVCWHIELVRPEIERRLAANPPADEAAMLQEFAGLLDAEVAEARVHGAGAYATLGYDADRLYYYGFARATPYWKLASPERAAFCRGLFFGALRRHPTIYLRKVARQWALYFREPYAPPSIQRPHVIDSLELSEKFLARPPVYLPPDLREHYRPVVEKARAELAGPWPTPPRLALSLRLVAGTSLLNPSFEWLLGIPMLLVLLAVLWRQWRTAIPWRRLAPVLGLALWATGSAAACALTSSALQALEVQRYIDLFLPLTVFSQFLWPFIAVVVLRHLAAGRRR